MFAATEIILLLGACFVAGPLILISVEIICAFFYKPNMPKPVENQLSLAIIIPAHNEELDIAETVSALKSQINAEQQLLVVADNCTDETAKIAQNAGAEVIVRNNVDERGKGFALDFGIQHLRSNPPDIVIIIDADCTITAGSLDVLTNMVAVSGKPVQALYLIRAHADCHVGQEISAFAMILKNHIRLLGLKLLGVPSHLTGSGMAFPWGIIKQADLASGNIVEDMKLGVDLVSTDQGSLFCPEAQVYSKFPESPSAQQEQRTRWEHGHLQTILSLVPILMWDSVRRKKWRNVVFALDLAVPPLSFLFILVITSLAITAIAAYFDIGFLAFALLGGACTLFFFSMLFAWWRFGKKALPARSLIGVPMYIFSKLTLYWRFIRQRQTSWIRTERR